MPYRLTGVALLYLAWGCASGGPSLGSALDALEEGRLPAAAGESRVLEPEVPNLPARERARYALYRGIVELGLGNAGVADGWLYAAWQADRVDPRCFDAWEHGESMAAWRSTGRLPGESGRSARTGRRR